MRRALARGAHGAPVIRRLGQDAARARRMTTTRRTSRDDQGDHDRDGQPLLDVADLAEQRLHARRSRSSRATPGAPPTPCTPADRARRSVPARAAACPRTACSRPACPRPGARAGSARAEARDQSLDGGTDAAIGGAAAERVGAAPADREPRRVAGEAAERPGDADGQRVHEPEVGGDAAEDQARGRPRPPSRRRPPADRSARPAPPRGRPLLAERPRAGVRSPVARPGSVTRSVSRLKTTRTGMSKRISSGVQPTMWPTMRGPSASSTTTMMCGSRCAQRRQERLVRRRRRCRPCPVPLASNHSSRPPPFQ